MTFSQTTKKFKVGKRTKKRFNSESINHVKVVDFTTALTPITATLDVSKSSLYLSRLKKILFIVVAGITVISFSGCEQTPPDQRAPVTLPIYEGGDSTNGKVLYEEHCVQCHKLQAGSNKKGPQLIGIYGAPAASLNDYKYTDELATSGWVWNAENLDPYIEDPLQVMPESKMLSDPMPNKADRQDIIAYLSTLGRAESSEAPNKAQN